MGGLPQILGALRLASQPATSHLPTTRSYVGAGGRGEACNFAASPQGQGVTEP